MKKSSTLLIIKEKSKLEDYFLWACYRQILKPPKPAMDQRKRHCNTGWTGVKWHSYPGGQWGDMQPPHNGDTIPGNFTRNASTRTGGLQPTCSLTPVPSGGHSPHARAQSPCPGRVRDWQYCNPGWHQSVLTGYLLGGVKVDNSELLQVFIRSI